jgi:hypothetical protein
MYQPGRFVTVGSRIVMMLALALTASVIPVDRGSASASGAAGPILSRSSHDDVSPSLRSLPDTHDATGLAASHAPFRTSRPASRTAATPSPTVPTAVPATSANFEGVGDGFTGPSGTYNVNVAPPDTNVAVGPNRVVQIVNLDFAVFDKTGPPILGPVATNTLWSGFGGLCQADNDGDLVVRCDRAADRWIIL